MAPSRKAPSSSEFPAIVSVDEQGDFHLGAVVNGVFVKFSSISRVHAPALAAQIQAEHAPAAVLVHHDQPRKIDVDFPEKNHESREFILMLHQPQGMLESV